jgi:hypothetical protein
MTMTDKDAAKLIRKSVSGGLWDFYGPACLLLIVVSFALGWFSLHDDTDPPSGRFGMEVKTDCLTGLQYLASASGGLTPRLGKDGAQISKDCK